MSSSLLLLPTDCPDWNALPMPQKDVVYKWLYAIKSLPSGVKVDGPGGMAELLSRSLGVKKGTARDKYFKWKKSQDWRIFVNGNTLRASAAAEGVRHPAFIAWAKTILDKHQRSEEQGLEEIKARILSRREIIPGLEHWTKPVLPPGCSSTNLRRILKRTKAQKQLAKWGYKSAANFMPSIRTTRKGLAVGQQYMFDDVWHDHYVTVKAEPVRVLEFGALDVYSGRRVSWGLMPRVEDKEEGKHRGLKNNMFRCFLANMLRYEAGFNVNGSLMMMEHGTATLDELYISALHDRTGGLIRVGMGGLQGKQLAHLGGWAERNAGNPYYKSMIEVMHSLMHNIMDALPGQAGRNRTQPGGTDGMVDYQRKLAKEWERLGRFADKLKSPFLSLDEFVLILREVYAILNERTRHSLEGWRECGHVIKEYMLAENVWTPEHRLPDPSNGARELAAWNAVRALVLADNSRLRERNLSPQEVWDLPAQQAQLAKIPLDLYAFLLGPEQTRTVSVKRAYITLQDKDLCPEPREYHARCFPAGARPYELTADKYDVVINPYNINHLLVMDARGRLLGECLRANAASRAEEDSVHRQMGIIAERRADLLEEYKVRHAQDRDDVAALKQHNQDVFDEAAGRPTSAEREAFRLTKAEKQSVTRTANEMGNAVDVFGGLGELPDVPDYSPSPDCEEDDAEETSIPLGLGAFLPEL